MSTGADNKSLPGTAAYRDEYDRIFGKDKKPERGLWIQHLATGELVAADEYVPPEEAKSAPIMVDRFYEGTKAPDGTDIGSRRKHRQYMKDHGLTTADDYKQSWSKAAERRERIAKGERGALPSKTRREAIARRLYQIDKP